MPIAARFGPGQIGPLQPAQQPLEPGPGRLLAVEGEGALAELDGRIQSRVLEMRRAAPLDNRRLGVPFTHLAEDVLLHHVNQARLAQTWLAHQQDDLPRAFLRPLPAIHEQPHLLLAAGQG